MYESMVEELSDRLADGHWDSWTEAELEERAARAFEHQFDRCSPYRSFCEKRGVTPGNVASWEDIPAVPATAFKYLDLVSVGEGGSAERAGLVFRTSGTARGPEARGRHHVPWPELYRASLLEPFRRALLPELVPRGRAVGDRPVGGSGSAEGDRPAETDGTSRPAVFVSLIPPPEEAPGSSLSFMVGAAAERLASEVVWLVDGSGAWEADAVERLAGFAEVPAVPGRPVLVLGTALAFVHLLEAGSEAVGGPRPRRAGDAPASRVLQALRVLPDGARLMETGGFKGARRHVSREELYRRLEKATGVARGRIVNEYGMTELLSQLYEPVLAEGEVARGLHVAPPWLRVRALDPTSLEPVPEGEEGILAFFDLANLGSVCHVLTEDVGSLEGGRLRLRGRASGAEPRGCSRAMDDLMSAAGG